MLSGAGVYGLYNFIEHPSGQYGALPFPCGGGGAAHVHPWLRIVINGQDVAIPAGLGLGACEQPLHTHDESGILHVEAASVTTKYTLGDFFQIWRATDGSVTIGGTQHQIVFNSTDILGFKVDQTHQLQLLVDGSPSTEWEALNLSHLDYCSASTTGPPCSPTAAGDPSWSPGQYPYGTGHTVVIEYNTVSG